ncbi:hypothetical protein [Verrucomicrobium spinosum]|nr:hypothetical protein [Verrucomicrobium spinosum]
MHRSLAMFLVWTTLCSGAAYSASFKFVNEGLEIDAGNLGD